MTIEQIRAELDSLSRESDRGCGLSYELFVAKFSGAVDTAFPEGSPQRDTALREARAMGYASPSELEQMQEELAEEGSCAHGFHPDYCPAGCGDLESYQNRDRAL
ncbi:hypothetical protein CAI21_21955 [Alkalilimnicola ehrlichii]|uniref:CcgAII protein n=2 Tax=Alkalilimnicola ehrlichii TaxID=351052 RepID=A0A3E0WIC0_9GAMM|nr:hypothetical protein CAI21_21955 [Alkalilimnicola ehrlichii]RFA31615.1 hypothetical protein CAL65_21970 [Alkalilimnicola ehrlichii]